MTFNSLAFLIFFPIVFLLHWALPHRSRWVLLLTASWLFYFWWDPWTGSLLAGTTVVSWLCAGEIARSEKLRAGRALLALTLAVSLGSLGLFKYADFFASMAGVESGSKLILPVGISFYTFQTLSYVTDVCRGTVRAFWRRWHISLTSWFTDHVYIPLGGSRCGLPRQIFNILAVFLVSFPWLFFRAAPLEDAVMLMARFFTGRNSVIAAVRQALPLALPLICLPLVERLPDRQRPRDRYVSALVVFCAVTAISAAWLNQIGGRGTKCFHLLPILSL